MGRVRETIRREGSQCWTLFDTGASKYGVVPDVAALLATSAIDQPFRRPLGWKSTRGDGRPQY